MLKKSVLFLVCSMTLSTFLSAGAANSIPDNSYSKQVAVKVCEKVPEPEYESIGPIKCGLDSNDVVAKLGQPEKKSDAMVWPTDGLEHQIWIYKSKGLQLNMVKDKNTFINTSINTITVTEPCKYKTKKNIGIGSTRKEVFDAYSEEIDPSASNKGTIVAGSINGGIVFSLKNDLVSGIFILMI